MFGKIHWKFEVPLAEEPGYLRKRICQEVKE